MRRKIAAIISIAVVLGIVGYLFYLGIDEVQFFTQLAVFLLGVVITLAIWGFRPEQKAGQGSQTTDDLLPEYREKYHQDLKNLFQLVENNIPNTHTKTPFDSVITLPFEQKRLIIQHFYTDEKYFHEDSRLYSSYRRYVGHINAIEDDKKALFEMLNDLVWLFDELNKKYKKSGTKLDREKLESALNLPVFTLGLSINYYRDMYFYQKLPHKLEIAIDRDSENKIFFTINSKRIGETDSFEDFHKVCDEIRPRLNQIGDSRCEIETAYATVDNWFSQIYSGSLIIALEPMKRGESIIGVCDGCIGCFSYEEKKKLKKLLKKFNTNCNLAGETTWRNKKPLRRSLSQIFTKNNTNSFRDSLE